MKCEGLLLPNITAPLTLHRPTLCLLTNPPLRAGNQSWHWLCSQNISMSNEMWMNNFSTVHCTIVGSVEIRQAWLSSHFLFTLMASLFCSMSPSLLRDMCLMSIIGISFNNPPGQRAGYPGLQGTWLEPHGETMDRAQLVRCEKVQKIWINISPFC